MAKKYLYFNILKAMYQKGETKYNLCKLLDTTYFTLERKLEGVSQWNIGDIETLCKHYNKDYYELFSKE